MTVSYQDLVNGARREIDEIDPAALSTQLPDVTLLDIREADEFEHGAISGAHLAPRGLLESVIGRRALRPGRPDPATDGVHLRVVSGRRVQPMEERGPSVEAP
jgi:rhodanese-related sulfurtransferase